MDDFFRVKGTLLRRSLRASFSVPPYMATCVAISMSVLISVFINCKETYASVFKKHRPQIGFVRRCWPEEVCVFSSRRKRGKEREREKTRLTSRKWYRQSSWHIWKEILVVIIRGVINRSSSEWSTRDAFSRKNFKISFSMTHYVLNIISLSV